MFALSAFATFIARLTYASQAGWGLLDASFIFTSVLLLASGTPIITFEKCSPISQIFFALKAVGFVCGTTVQ